MDLTSRINQIYGGLPRPPLSLVESMPMLARPAFQNSGPMLNYAGTVPIGDVHGTEGMGGQGLRPSVAPVQPDMGAQGMQPTAGPVQPDMGAQGVRPTGGLLDEPRANVASMGDKLRAFGRGQQDQQQQRAPQVPPLPSIVSAGGVGGRAGADINVLQYMRGFGRR